MNKTLLYWENKTSHPWIMVITIPYEGKNGMPNSDDYALLDSIENEIMKELKDHEGYLNIGRETGCNERVIYFACKEFRNPARLLQKIIQQYQQQFAIDFTIYKDKYWFSLSHFVK